MWQLTELEKKTESRLKKDLERVRGQEVFARYVLARKHIVEEIAEEIKAMQPNLTDHGPEHIRNVIENVHLLVDTQAKGFSGVELYCILLICLFHDLGNYYDRDNHRKTIQGIYDFVFPGVLADDQEKMIVLRAVEAHCGAAADGSYDTLASVPASVLLWGKPVAVRRLAALIRFGDELAEGTQRTSLFRLDQNHYEQGSRMYQLYARTMSVGIDGGNERIALTYHIKIELDGDGNPAANWEAALVELLEFVYGRIIKLDQERKFCKHYCNKLVRFKTTSISFFYWIDGTDTDIGQTDLLLTDLVVPKDNTKTVPEINKAYDPQFVLDQLREKIAEESQNV